MWINRQSLVLAFSVLLFTAGIAPAQSDDADAASVKFVTLHTFTGADGAYASGPLVQATNGEFYGMTDSGGTNCAATSGLCGTIFKTTPSGALTTLYSFCSQAGCLDGKGPYGGLVQATDSGLYGTTYAGGGAGTVFQISQTGALTTLHDFCEPPACADGADPIAGLVQAADGNLYGTTQVGGAYGGETVFRITPTGTLTAIYEFCAQGGCADGKNPNGGLVQAKNGDLYGTTAGGGITNSACSGGCGTIFKITPPATLTTLYSLCSQPGCTDGSSLLYLK